ncbi:hypothetical protein [Inquilinus sp. CA228]|uniref:hypothetical protein n=1 Tax=Inquilinus sp. CA228 TaxID=3455609 RepID=UPI003F8D7972
MAADLHAADPSIDGTTMPDRRKVLLAVGAFYVSFGLITALLQGGLPPILRARGMAIDGVAWTFALYLPFGLSFLWAPVVDRRRLPFLTPRVGWIVAMLAVAVAGLIAVALSEALPLPALFAIGLAVALAVATMDLALDALTVELTGAAAKPFAAAVKLAGLAIGAMIGGGVFVGLLSAIGWAATFALVALLMAITLLPVLALTDADRRIPRRRQPPGHALLAFQARPQMVRRLGVLVFASCIIFPLSALNRVMLVDLGVSLDRIAWVVGTIQPVGLLGVSLAAAPLIRRFGHAATVAAFALACLAALAAMGFGYRGDTTAAAIAGALVMAAGVAGIFVVMASLILTWAEGDQVATDYAVLFGGCRLAGIVATIAAGKLIAGIGWTAFYAFGAAGILLAAGLLLRCLPRDGQRRAPSAFPGTRD